MLHAVVLAGGSGTRFWPLSRRERPKQLLALASERSLLQEALDRARAFADPGKVWVVTSAQLAAGVREQAPELDPRNVLVEPQPKDTAVAIGLAARLIAEEDPDAVLAVTPSDHVIRPVGAFAARIRIAADVARQRGVPVTIGIPPRSPHTGYGYIRRGEPLPAWPRAALVKAFEEKPDRATAERYLAGGEHLWNAGVFVWQARTVLDLLRAHLPATRDALDRIAAAWPDERALADEYGRVQKISIDYAVLEKASGIVVLEADFAWSDVGGWAALAELAREGVISGPGLTVDDRGNAARGAQLVALDASGCFVQGDGRPVVILGLDRVAVVQTADATLVVPLDKAEQVKDVVKQLPDRLT
jgi:mannose-1-phosphate guanylyltransferase